MQLTYWTRIKILMISGPKVTVVLQQRVRVPDGRGGSNDVWNDIEEFKAVLSPVILTKEGLKYNKELREIDYILYPVKVPSVTINDFHRITYNGRIFQIKAVDSPMMNTKILKIGLLEIK